MKKHIPILAFCAVELVLYGLILTTGGAALVASSYGAIILCFAFGLLHGKSGDRWLVAGLAFTLLADWCLVVCAPIQQLWGMIFFLGTQSMYALRLHLQKPNRILLILRIALTAVAVGIAVVVLREKTDALALVSIGYYANLIMNIVAAFGNVRENKVFSLALVLFLLCDTVIGLQVAAGGYLPIEEGSLLHRILFMDFHLSWFFYLPSQVLIALTAAKKVA